MKALEEAGKGDPAARPETEKCCNNRFDSAMLPGEKRARRMPALCPRGPLALSPALFSPEEDR